MEMHSDIPPGRRTKSCRSRHAAILLWCSTALLPNAVAEQWTIGDIAFDGSAGRLEVLLQGPDLSSGRMLRTTAILSRASQMVSIAPVVAQDGFWQAYASELSFDAGDGPFLAQWAKLYSDFIRCAQVARNSRGFERPEPRVRRITIGGINWNVGYSLMYGDPFMIVLTDPTGRQANWIIAAPDAVQLVIQNHGGLRTTLDQKYREYEVLLAEEKIREEENARKQAEIARVEAAQAEIRAAEAAVRAAESARRQAELARIEAAKAKEKAAEAAEMARVEAVQAEKRAAEAARLKKEEDERQQERNRVAEERLRAGRERPFVNSLGMKFVPVLGFDALFCIWETRKRDYAAFAHASGDVDAPWQDPAFEGQAVTPTGDHPVVMVSWDDAKRFCGWLTEKELQARRIPAGAFYRLPTDLEWSAAVGLVGETDATPQYRNGKIEDVYPWGTQWRPSPEAGNYADETLKLRAPSRSSIIGGYRDGHAMAAPVGSFAPNRFGLFDLGGNVWEWCEDFYDGHSGARVLRGASWAEGRLTRLLSSYRSYGTHGVRDANIGFRVVLMGASPR